MVAAKTSLVWETFLFGVIDRNEDLAQKLVLVSFYKWSLLSNRRAS
jgi:hypothetical protein